MPMPFSSWHRDLCLSHDQRLRRREETGLPTERCLCIPHNERRKGEMMHASIRVHGTYSNLRINQFSLFFLDLSTAITLKYQARIEECSMSVMILLKSNMFRVRVLTRLLHCFQDLLSPRWLLLSPCEIDSACFFLGEMISNESSLQCKYILGGEKSRPSEKFTWMYLHCAVVARKNVQPDSAQSRE